MTDDTAARLRALDRDAVERLMKRCQVGVGGRNALNEAHDIMADCYGTLGRMLLEIDALRRELRVAEARASEAYKATIREIDDEWFKQHDAAMALIAAHNAECERLCHRDIKGGRCEAYVSRGRECTDCPRDWMIDKAHALLGGDKGA